MGRLTLMKRKHSTKRHSKTGGRTIATERMRRRTWLQTACCMTSAATCHAQPRDPRPSQSQKSRKQQQKHWQWGQLQQQQQQQRRMGQLKLHSRSNTFLRRHKGWCLLSGTEFVLVCQVPDQVPDEDTSS